jgi:RNA polymerase sigma-70 factor (ECF subfamily)
MRSAVWPDRLRWAQQERPTRAIMSSISLRHPSPPNPATELAERAAGVKEAAAFDAELVRRFNAGDELAFVEIMHRHERRIFNLVLGSIHDHAEAEEITEDAFIRAYRGLSRFRGECSLATWLYHVALNLARNRYWFLLRRRNLAGSLDAPVGPDGKLTRAEIVASSEADPAQELERNEFSCAVAACLQRLPARQREILALRGILNRSYAQIACALAINVGTVKSRIARARRNLRSHTSAMCPGPWLPEVAPARTTKPARANRRLVPTC